MTGPAALRLAVLLAGVLYLAACSDPAPPPTAVPDAPLDTPAPAPASSDAAPGPGPEAAPAAAVEPGPVPTPERLPTRPVPFRVHAPDGTPEGEVVHVLVQPSIDWDWLQHVPLTDEGDNVWTGQVSLPEGALVRYVYDRWDEVTWGDPFKETREGHGEAVPIESRYLLVAPDLDRVEDTIETWNDARGPAATGSIAGSVVDSSTGGPLMDTNVSIGGIHTATDYLGRFHVADVAAGSQRITVHRNLGDYRAAWTAVEVGEGETVEVGLSMEPASPVRVSFEVDLPEDTPPDAEVRIAGSAFQTGARYGPHLNYPLLPGMNVPVLDRVSPSRAAVVLDLYEGMHVRYQYTLGIGFSGTEKSADGAEVYRDMIVDPSDPVQRDRVAAWRPPGAVRVTLKVEVPADTTPDAPVAMLGHWMARTGPNEWTAHLHGYPGAEQQYELTLGASSLGADGTGALQDGRRTLVFPDADAVVHYRVGRWEWGRPAASVPPNGMASVTFRVSVPASTPPDATVRLVGDVPPLDSGVELARHPGNPWMYEVRLSLPPSETAYSFELGAGGPRSERRHTASIRFKEQVIDDWVVAWSDAEAGPDATGRDYITGVFTPDLWAPEMLSVSAQTYERLRSINAEWVVVSSVWSYGQTRPLPTLEPRSVAAGSVRTPRPDAIAQAGIAHAQGLKVILVPQFNMEMSPGGADAVCAAQTDAWWDAWLDLADRFWMWNALLAEEAGAEALLLPGNCFHVFPGEGSFETEEFAAEFDRRLSGLVDKVRGVYGGRLIISGAETHYGFPGLADLIGTTTFDTGHPDLPYDATVEEWTEAYDSIFAERVDPLYERWGKPVLLYTVHLPPHPDDPDATGESFQAKRLEAIFQALVGRPWVAGTLSWGYTMIDAPLANGEGLRSRMAEAVLAKYYGTLAGR